MYEAIAYIFKQRIFTTAPYHDKPVAGPQADNGYHCFQIQINGKVRRPAKAAPAKNKGHNKAERRYSEQYQPAIVKPYFTIGAPHVVKI